MFEIFRISLELLERARIQRITHEEAITMGFRFKGQLDGIMIPYIVAGQQINARIRRDKPERGEGGKPENKYVCLTKETAQRALYRVPGTETQLGDVAIPIFFVEAEKSVLALSALLERTKKPAVVLGTGGCRGWMNGGGKPLPDFEQITWTGRHVAICFDSNVTTNPDVQEAERALVEELRKRGAIVQCIRLPQEEGVNGPDDFIAIHPDDEFLQLLLAAPKQDESEFDAEADRAEFHDKPTWKELTVAQKDAVLSKYARKVVRWLQQRGRVVRLQGELVLLTPTEQLAINKAEDGILAQAVYRTAKTVIVNYWAKEIVGRVLIQLDQIANKVQLGRHSIIEPESIIVATNPSLLRVSAEGVQAVSNPLDYLFTSVGKLWKYQKLTTEEMKAAAVKFKHLLADSQATAPDGQMAFALALSIFPFIRSWLTTRPIFPHLSDEGGDGKSFGADRFAYLLYGESGVKTSTAAAARRAVDPFVLYDDVDDMPQWLQQHLKRAATGIHHSSVNKDFQVEDSEQGDSINAFTATRIPKDNPLLTRFWPRTFSKKFFKPEFASETEIRREILGSRDLLLSLVLEVLAEALREGQPDLSTYGKLPYPRTLEAQQWLLRLLRALDRLAPEVIDPEAEFQGFLKSLRSEETDTKGLATDELNLLEQLFEILERADDNTLMKFAQDGIEFSSGQITATATALSKQLNKMAREQGLRLKHSGAINIGKWLGGEVNSSIDFTATKIAISTGGNKRNGWQISHKANKSSFTGFSDVPDRGKADFEDITNLVG
jgi:hypothetical protein